MGDVDEMVGALAIVFAKEVGDAPFGDDVVNVRSRSDDAGALLERRYDFTGALVRR